MFTGPLAVSAEQEVAEKEEMLEALTKATEPHCLS